MEKFCLHLLSQGKEHFTHIMKIKLERNSHLRLEVMCDGTTVNRFHPVWTWEEGGPAVPRLLSASQTPCTAKTARTQSNLTSIKSSWLRVFSLLFSATVPVDSKSCPPGQEFGALTKWLPSGY
jgi:hypothetical protein